LGWRAGIFLGAVHATVPVLNFKQVGLGRFVGIGNFDTTINFLHAVLLGGVLLGLGFGVDHGRVGFVLGGPRASALAGSMQVRPICIFGIGAAFLHGCRLLFRIATVNYAI